MGGRSRFRGDRNQYPVMPRWGSSPLSFLRTLSCLSVMRVVSESLSRPVPFDRLCLGTRPPLLQQLTNVRGISASLNKLARDVPARDGF